MSAENNLEAGTERNHRKYAETAPLAIRSRTFQCQPITLNSFARHGCHNWDCCNQWRISSRNPGLVKKITFENSASDPGSYVLAMYYVIFAYGGWAHVNYILDEVHLGLGSTTILYLLANLSYFRINSVLIKAEINASNRTIAANFFTKAIGSTFGIRCPSRTDRAFALRLLLIDPTLALELFWKPVVKDFFLSQTILGLYILVLVFLFAPPPGSVFSFIVTFAGYRGAVFALLAVVGALGSVVLVLAFYPPKSASSSYPYYVPYITSIVVVILTVGLWYYQFVVRKVPENSFNAQIGEIARRDVAREVFGPVSKTDVETSVTSGSDNGDSSGVKPTQSKALAGKPVDAQKAAPGN
ncbi:hypothetical protein BJ742DRAFT_875427 [Cladochytrium replicatum]|nr:hypothetical protein BJ742DRAFT_875427 [Cladochytrium replicatum]